MGLAPHERSIRPEVATESLEGPAKEQVEPHTKDSEQQELIAVAIEMALATRKTGTLGLSSHKHNRILNVQTKRRVQHLIA
jgi:hypothetical protein